MHALCFAGFRVQKMANLKGLKFLVHGCQGCERNAHPK